MMSIVFKEGLNIPPPALNEIILGANQDVRQVTPITSAEGGEMGHHPPIVKMIA